MRTTVESSTTRFRLLGDGPQRHSGCISQRTRQSYTSSTISFRQARQLRYLCRFHHRPLHQPSLARVIGPSLTLRSNAFTRETAATGDPLRPNYTHTVHLDCVRSPINGIVLLGLPHVMITLRIRLHRPAELTAGFLPPATASRESAARLRKLLVISHAVKTRFFRSLPSR
jgi:hypothetical protein